MTNQNRHLPLPECKLQNGTRLSFIAQKVYGDPERWREIAELNGTLKDNPYRMGDCLMSSGEAIYKFTSKTTSTTYKFTCSQYNFFRIVA